MRTVISGRVTPDVLDRADLISGIEPTSYVTNGAPVPAGLPVETHPICKKLGDAGEQARNYTLCQNADALICVGHNPHLVGIATMYGLPVHQE